MQGFGATFTTGMRALVWALAMLLCVSVVAPAQAQFRGFAPSSGEDIPVPPAPVGPASPPPMQTQPLPPPRSLQPPSVPTPLPSAVPVPAPPAGQATLAVMARFGVDGPPINAGLIWRIYPARPDKAGVFRELKEDRGANPTFSLPAGDYVVHVALGLASTAKAIHLRPEPARETFDLGAGGLRIEGRVGDARIPPTQISFDIYKGSQFEPGDKQPLARNVLTGQVLVVPEGTYYIISNYGDGNSVVRSDIRVMTGKLTDVTVTHRAAVITLKLVDKSGGEALANTQWSVLTPGGDTIKESTGAFPRVVLSEGDYRAIARNEGQTYERVFKVITGVDGEIEVVAR